MIKYSTLWIWTPCFGLSLGLLQAKPLKLDSLTVHEWGTFTTLSTSEGKNLSGLFVDATRLPKFVQGLPAFNFDAQAGWSKPDQIKNVTVKMETPVLYFYTDKAQDIEVEVGFKGGTISQWYPERISGETNPTGPVDFSDPLKPYIGKISWKARILGPQVSLPYSTKPGEETHEWVAPRHTQSNLLQGYKGEIEKFLFYRGLGNFPSLIETHFTTEGMLVIKNRGEVTISHVMVYENQTSTLSVLGGPMQTPTIWWEGTLAPGESVMVSRKPGNWSETSAAKERLRMAMIKAGLFEDESRSLLDTWEQSYFTVEKGLKVFWLVPRPEIDRLLPLKMNPLPTQLERVIVGRSDILTPEIEAELVQAYLNNGLEDYKKDKYFLAYLDFVKNRGGAMHPTDVSNNSQLQVNENARRAAGLKNLRGNSKYPGAFKFQFHEKAGAPYTDANGRERP